MARRERTELTVEAEARIQRVIRSLSEDTVDRGIDLSRPMRCSSCDLEKPPQGAAQYGAYQLCNDCLLDFTRALARGDVDNVAEFMTKRLDVNDGEGPPEATHEASPVRTVHMSIPKRGERLMPRNEPC